MTIQPSELDFSSAKEVAKAIQNHYISSLEITSHILDRIDQYNPKINAIVTPIKDKAIKRAQAADKALAKGEIWGPLHGVPCTIKDTFTIKGVRTTAGSPELSNYIPEQDAIVVAREPLLFRYRSNASEAASLSFNSMLNSSISLWISIPPHNESSMEKSPSSPAQRITKSLSPLATCAATLETLTSPPVMMFLEYFARA